MFSISERQGGLLLNFSYNLNSTIAQEGEKGPRSHMSRTRKIFTVIESQHKCALHLTPVTIFCTLFEHKFSL